MPRCIRSLALALPLVLAAACSADLTPTAPSAAVAVVPPPACVFFNVPPLGAVFGAPAGHIPGQIVFAENAIPVSVHRFHHPGGLTSFNRADIVPTPLAGFGAGKVARINNINLGFDFTGIGFVPSYVEFEWLDQGGHENLAANGSPIFIGELDAPPAFLAGMPVNSAFFPVAIGQQGRTRITGPVQRMLVGGQEFYLDNVCAYP